MSAGNVRLSSARLVMALEKGHSLSTLLANEETTITKSDRPFFRQLIYGTCRHYHSLRALRKQLIAKPLKPRDADINALILVGIYQLTHTRVPAHAIVKETVNAALLFNKSWAKGLVNAVLRETQRKKEELLAWINKNADEQARYEHPQWFINHCKRSWPDHWQNILQQNNRQAPMTLRVNTAQITRKDYCALLSKVGMASKYSTISEAGIVLEHACHTHELPGFYEGMVSVQDEAAQLSAPLMDCQPGERILDACAAPGGKACHLLEKTKDLKLYAIDIDKNRLDRVRENMDRLRLDATLIHGNALTPEDWWDGMRFDRILLDAPCSATGVIRRHPDIKLLRRESDIERLSVLQGDIMDRLWQLLKPEGRLVYATCSVLPEENSDQIDRFLTQHQNAKAGSIPEVFHGNRDQFGIQFLPEERSCDGFFYSVLIKDGE